jgi:hypothetical protein
MKDFATLRSEINEVLEEHVNIPHNSMPPNILILRRKTVRQFPNQTMVALYYNEKLDQYFSIPYGAETSSVVTPVALKEAAYKSTPQRAKWMAEFEKHVTQKAPEHTGKIDWDSAHHMHFMGKGAKESAEQYVNTRRQLPESVQLNEGVIDRLKHIRDFHAMNHIQHADGTRTRVDPTTAHALLTVHHALHPDNQEKMERAVAHSKPKFHKMVDFAWKQVR